MGFMKYSSRFNLSLRRKKTPQRVGGIHELRDFFHFHDTL